MNLQNTVQVWQFVIPGGPSTKITTKITAAQTAPFTMDVADPVAGLFPTSGEVLVSKNEVMVYNTFSCSPTATQLCITARAKVGTAVQHDPPATGSSTDPFDPDGRVKLVTQLTSPLPATQSPQTTLTAAITSTANPPFAISVADNSAFPASGEITISHQDVDAGGQSTEFMEYDHSCGTAAQLCITARALNINNVRSAHSASGYTQPCTINNAQVSCPQGGVTKVTLHSDISVKSTTGFFPATPLLIYNPTAGLGNAEIVDAVKGDASAKLTSPPPASGTTFRVTGRGGATAAYDKTAIATHSVNSIVTGADELVTCRVRYEQPGAFTEPGSQSPGTSVGAFMVCYSRMQPGEPPKEVTDEKKLNVPIVGSPFIVLNALGQPFLSTGGFNHTLYGPVLHVDADGTSGNSPGDSQACDLGGSFTLCLTTPCITNFTPGINLAMNIAITTDKDYTTADAGAIQVVLDTVHDDVSGNGDECDDPAGTSDLITTTYIYPGDPNTADDDTDGDGCRDNFELYRGGQRDPWNPWDFFDPDWDPLTASGNNTSISLGNILNVAGRFGATGSTAVPFDNTVPSPGYNRAFDRGAGYGPFGQNTAEPNGSIGLSDILVIASQFGVSECAGGGGGPTPTSTPTPCPPEGCPTSEMWLSIDGGDCDDPDRPTKCTVPDQGTFALLVHAAAGVEIGGLASEAIFESGIDYVGKACLTEAVTVPAPGACLPPFVTTIPSGTQVAHGISTTLLPPRPAFTSIDPSIRMPNLMCAATGTYDITLTIFSANSPLGAVMSSAPDGVDDVPVPALGNVNIDYGSGPVSVPYADQVTINCEDIPTFTPTTFATPTSTPTPTATPTPTPTFIPKQGLIFPVAGGGAGDGLPGASAALSSPADVETGNSVYIADAGHCRVRLLSDLGTITTIAGTGVCGDAGDGGLAVDAELDAPSGVTVDGSDNVYVADSGTDTDKCRVRVVDGATGNIDAFAGTGACGLSGDGGAATSAQLDAPYDVLATGGDVYIVDRGNCQLRVVSGGTISRVAGDAGGACASSGDGGLAINAQLDDPRRVAIDAPGNLYLSEACAVRKIDTGGTITTIAGTGTCGFSGDGTATSVQLDGPDGVAVDSAGDVLIADANNCRVRELSGGTLMTVAGTGTCGYDGEGADATTLQLNDPAGIDTDGSDRIFLADRGNHRVRRIGSPITTVAGTGLPDFCGDTFVAIEFSCLAGPNDVVIDTAGNVFIADTGNRRVRWVDVTSGAIYTIAGKTDLSSCPTADGGSATDLCLPEPLYLALDEDQEQLFVSDRQRNQVWALNLSGLAPLTPPTATRVAGSSSGTAGSCADGVSARGACLDAPTGLAFQEEGATRYLFIAQENNTGSVARVDLDASSIREVFDNGIASADLELGLDGSLYVGQPADQRVRRVYHGGNGLVEGPAADAGETVAVVAGDGTTGQPAEGGLAVDEALKGPFGLGQNPDGGLLIGDRDNHTLWVVTEIGVAPPIEISGGPDERILRIAGDGSFAPAFCGDPKAKPDPTPPNAHQAREACLDSPAGISYHGATGALFFADGGNDRVRKIPSDCDADGLTDFFEDGFPGNYTPDTGFPPPTNEDPLDRCRTDSDGDGCWDSRELGINEPLGGRRDPTNRWDFFNPDWDVNIGAGANRAVSLGNILNVAGRFGALGDPNDPWDNTAEAATYNQAFDRGPLVGPNGWNSSAPNGAISLGTVLIIASQFAHNCG